MAAQENTTRRCFCSPRITAAGSHSFRFSYRQGAWYFVDSPTRSMSKSAHFRAFIDRSEYEHTDHSGEPVYWIDCPYCGGILPGTEREGENRSDPTSQGDGDEVGGGS